MNQLFVKLSGQSWKGWLTQSDLSQPVTGKTVENKDFR